MEKPGFLLNCKFRRALADRINELAQGATICARVRDYLRANDPLASAAVEAAVTKGALGDNDGSPILSLMFGPPGSSGVKSCLLGKRVRVIQQVIAFCLQLESQGLRKNVLQ